MAPTFGWSAYARRHSRLVLSTLAATLIAAMPATAVAKVGPHREANAGNRTDAFYTETNTRANAVLVCKRNPTAHLVNLCGCRREAEASTRRQSTFRLWMAQAR